MLLGKDHPIPQQILDTLKANPKTLDKQLCAITSVESQKVARQEREDEEAEVQDGVLLRTVEPDQPKPTLPDQSHAQPASNPCVYQSQAKEKVEQEKKEGEMGVEEDKDEVDWDDEDEVDWEEDGEERVEEDLSLEGRVRGQDKVSAILSFSSVVLHREDNSNCDSDILTMPVADYSCSHCDVKLRSCIFGF